MKKSVRKQIACESTVKDFSLFTSHLSLKSAAFTLAETLITLGIIGVVAAITLSSLVNSYQKHTTVNQLKAAYQMFSEIISRAKSDYDGDLPVTLEMIKNATLAGNNWMISEAYFEPYIIGAERVYIKQDISKTRIKNLSRKGTDFLFGYPNKSDNTNPICTPKGFCYWVYMLSGYNNDTEKYFHNYINLVVDLNGPKGPNVMGRDVFAFQLDEKNKGDDYYITGLSVNFRAGYKVSDDRDKIKQGCNKTSTDRYNGFSCSVLIVKDNWEIAPDYPW